jgi:hypothetical protein
MVARPIFALALVLFPSLAGADSTVPGAVVGGFWQVRCANELQAASRETRIFSSYTDGRARPFMHKRALAWQRGAYVPEEHVNFTAKGMRASVEASDEVPADWLATTDSAEGGFPTLTRIAHRRRALVVLVDPSTRTPQIIERWKSALDRCLDADDHAPPGGRFAGHWRVTSEITSETCPHRIYMQARNFEIDASERWIRWDVGEGSEEIVSKNGNGFVARDTFAPWSSGADACPGTLAYDDWNATLDHDGSLVGSSTATWNLKPNCARTCTTVFHMRALRR